MLQYCTLGSGLASSRPISHLYEIQKKSCFLEKLIFDFLANLKFTIFCACDAYWHRRAEYKLDNFQPKSIYHLFILHIHSIIYLYCIALHMGRYNHNNYNRKKIPNFRVITLFKFVLAPSMLPGLDYMCLCLYI